MLQRFLQRLGLLPAAATLDERTRREIVSRFIVDMRWLGAEEGPWRLAADLGAAPGASCQEIAYLFVWRLVPPLRIWTDLQALDAVDLAIDSLAEGFRAYVAAEDAAPLDDRQESG